MTGFHSGVRAENEGPKRARSAFLAATAVLVALALWPGAATAASINRSETIHEDYFLNIALSDPGFNDPWTIDVTWSSSMAIDVWVMDDAEYTRYAGGSTFASDVQQSGTSGVVHFTVSSARLNDEPFHLVFDNTDTGPTDPPVNGVDDIATVSANGDTRSQTANSALNTANSIVNSFLLLAGIIAVVALVGTVLVIVYALSRRKQAAAPVVVAMAPTVAAPGAVGGAMAAPAMAPMAQPPAPSAGAFCASCGSPLTPGSAFCNKCGAKV